MRARITQRFKHSDKKPAITSNRKPVQGFRKMSYYDQINNDDKCRATFCMKRKVACAYVKLEATEMPHSNQNTSAKAGSSSQLRSKRREKQRK